MAADVEVADSQMVGKDGIVPGVADIAAPERYVVETEPGQAWYTAGNQKEIGDARHSRCRPHHCLEGGDDCPYKGWGMDQCGHL